MDFIIEFLITILKVFERRSKGEERKVMIDEMQLLRQFSKPLVITTITQAFETISHRILIKEFGIL